MKETELHWLAGLLEGEGSFLASPPSERNQPRVVLEMTDLDIIERASALMGVNYLKISKRNSERWKPSYRIQLKGSRGIELMRRLRPLMGERRGSRIDEILAGYTGTSKRRLSEPEARSILEQRGKSRARDVATAFGLHIKTVEEIWRGKRWAKLER